MNAALLIDGENVAYTKAWRIIRRAEQQGELTVRLVYGNWDVLQNWLGQSIIWNLQMHVTQRGRRNEADERIKDDFWALYEAGVRTFYLSTHDGGFSSSVRNLVAFGCEVIGIGLSGRQPASRLVRACSTYDFV